MLGWAFLAVSLAGAACTATAYRPVRAEPLSVPTFFVGWLTSELPVHTIAWQAAATAGFAAAGALDSAPGWAGLAVSVASWAALAALVVQAHRARHVLEDALRNGIGTDGAAEAEPEAGLVPGAGLADRLKLALPFLLRDRRVERIRNIDYWDGRRAHRLDIYRPRAGCERAPVLVYIHGGAWVMGDKREQGLPMMLHLAARGWVCVTVNYRLSPRVRFPAHLVDCKRALAWVHEHIAEWGGDPSFVAVSGGSAGGHLAALVALTAGDPAYQPGFEDADTSVHACVPFYGVYDLTNRDGLRGVGFARFIERLVMPAPLHQDPDAWCEASPMDRVHDDAPPFCVVHGANDTLVPVGEARGFVELLRNRSRRPVVYAELPGAQHAFEVFRSVRSAHTVAAVAAFLEIVLGRHRGAAPVPALEPARERVRSDTA